jgi:hypothetical protein
MEPGLLVLCRQPPNFDKSPLFMRVPAYCLQTVYKWPDPVWLCGVASVAGGCIWVRNGSVLDLHAGRQNPSRKVKCQYRLRSTSWLDRFPVGIPHLVASNGCHPYRVTGFIQDW